MGGCLLGIDSGGSAEPSDTGGAAAELTGLWFGAAGIAKPKRGTLFPKAVLPAPGTGGLSNGAGEAMSPRSGGFAVRFGSATLGYQAGTRLSKKAGAIPALYDSLLACQMVS